MNDFWNAVGTLLGAILFVVVCIMTIGAIITEYTEGEN